jgi:hypothetical protein
MTRLTLTLLAVSAACTAPSLTARTQHDSDADADAELEAQPHQAKLDLHYGAALDRKAVAPLFVDGEDKPDDADEADLDDGEDDDDDQGELEDADEDTSDGGGGGAGLARSGLRAAEPSGSHSPEPPPSPAPSVDAIRIPGLRTIDPQIAVGRKYILTAAYNQLSFFDRGTGAFVKVTDPKTNKSRLTLSTWAMFRRLVEPSTCHGPGATPDCNEANINHFLNLPPGGGHCDPTHPDAFGVIDDCIHEVYDVRVRYEPISGRFFVLGHARNHTSGTEKKWWIPHALHRAKNVLAVTRSEDPADGWDLYWWNQADDDGICTDVADCPAGTNYRPGQAADYPTFTVDDTHLALTNSITSSPKYVMITIIPTDALLHPPPNWDPGTPTTSVPSALLQIAAPRGALGAPVKDYLRPVQNHTPSTRQYFVRRYVRNFVTSDGDKVEYDRGLELFWFDDASNDPSWLSVRRVPTKISYAPHNIHDPSGHLYKVTNMGGAVLNAVRRGDQVVVTWQDCIDWVDPDDQKIGAPCTTAPRIAVIDVAKDDPPAVLWNRALPPDDLQAHELHGLPGVEMTASGDLVVGYGAAGPALVPSVEYAVMPPTDAGTWSFLAPARLTTGAGDRGGDARFDTAGISIDPGDPDQVWIAHCSTRVNPISKKSQNVIVMGAVRPRP